MGRAVLVLLLLVCPVEHAQVASLADLACVELAVGVFAVCRELEAPLAVVAVAAEAVGIEVLVGVLTGSDDTARPLLDGLGLGRWLGLGE